jgi:hypothetical protein
MDNEMRQRHTQGELNKYTEGIPSRAEGGMHIAKKKTSGKRNKAECSSHTLV